MSKLSYRSTIHSCYLGYVVQAIVNNLPPLLFLTFQKELALPVSQIGLLITINFSTQILVDLLSARYVDRIGYRRCMVIAHLCCTVGLILLGILPRIIGYPGLVIAMMINAIGGGLLEVLVSPIVQASPSTEKSSAMSMLHSFYCWGSVVVILFSTLLFSLVGSSHWYYLPWFWAFVPMINCVMFSLVPIATLNEKGESLGLRQLFSLPLFWILALMMVCSGASELAMSQWASMFAESGLKVSKTVGDLLGPCCFAFLMGLVRLFFGKKGDKLDLRLFISISSLFCVASYLVTVFSPNPLVALLGCALCGPSVALFWPGTFSLSASLCPRGGTVMFALLAFFGDIGCAFGPAVVSTVANIQGTLRQGLLYATIFPVLLCILAFWGLKGNKKARVSHGK